MLGVHNIWIAIIMDELKKKTLSIDKRKKEKKFNKISSPHYKEDND